MADAAHEYQSGDQDITEQEATFDAFGRMVKWASLTVVVLVTMLVLWFCVGAGVLAGLAAGAAILAAGIYFLRSKPEPAH